MWPWEHAAVAYISYSVVSRVATGETPRAGPVVALLVGSQLPDLIDKPLAWWLQILPSGRSLGHSLFFALPFVTMGVWVARRYRRTDIGVALGLGYLLHLPGDVVYPVLLGDNPAYGFLLYPIVPREGYVESGALGKISGLFGEFLGFLQTPRGMLYLSGELGLVVVALWLWVWDGKPGLGAFSRRLRRAIAG